VSGGASIDSFVYTYGSGGRLKTETNTEGLATYGYDAANQLTSVTRPVGQTGVGNGEAASL
jgi:YD repeat-containing protein